MTKSSKLKQNGNRLDISELQSIQHVEAMQKEMLQLLKQSHVDPISYVGLEYCRPDRCARLNCSEACWFGTLRRRIPEVLAIRRLMEQQDGALHKIVVLKPAWGCPYGWLHYIKPSISRAETTRIFNCMCSMRVVGVGTVEIIPAGFGDKRYFCEIHAIVGGAPRQQIELGFSFVDEGQLTVGITEITDLDAAIDEVMGPNLMKPRDEEPPGPTELTEFYTWLANMQVGARLFRYGCDQNFELTTDRKIRWPTPKKDRSGRRRKRYYKFPKRKPYRPWDASRSSYYDQE
jgi:hypothetical protein